MTGATLMPKPLSLERIQSLIDLQERHDEEMVHLTANETVLSPLAQRALASDLDSRYLLEHLEMRQDSPSRLGNFLYHGLNGVNEIERSATTVCREMFSASHIEFRPLSGLHAMQTTLAALTAPGETVMRVSTKDGGHFLTELLCRTFGRRSCAFVTTHNGEIDIDRTRAVIRNSEPSLILIDAMNYLFPFPLAELREIAGSTPIVFDASHTLGLIAGGQFADPLTEGADVVQANTHKTFFGPQKGIIFGNNVDAMERIGYVLSNGFVSSQHTGATLALFIAAHEMYKYGSEYAQLILQNALLAGGLDARGIPVVEKERGFTGNHMLFVDVRSLGSGPELLHRLLKANISVNRLIAFEHVDSLRMGVQEITRRGYGREDISVLAGWIADILQGSREPDDVRGEVIDLAETRREIRFCDLESDRKGMDAMPPHGPGAEALMPGSNGGGSHRWVRTRLSRRSLDLDGLEGFDEARMLGRIAGRFEDQTDTAGNVSFCSGGRQFVTASGAYIKELGNDDFVELNACYEQTLDCCGTCQPSSESYMHYLLRESVDARYVVHNHYIPLGKNLPPEIAVISPQEYGSIQLAEAVVEAASLHQIIYVRRHGFLFWSKSLDECVSLVQGLSV